MTSSKHRRSSSLGAFISFFKPNVDITRTLRNEYQDDSPHTATDLVFGIIDQTNDQPLASRETGDLDSQGIYKDWLKSDNLDLALHGYPTHSGPDREQSRDGLSPEVSKRSKGLKHHFNPKKILERGSEFYKRLRKDDFKGEGSHLYHHSNQSTILPQLPNTEPTRSIHNANGTSQEIYECKKFVRHHRRSMKQSDDYLGVRGANPRTGLWDSSESSTNYKKEKPDFATRIRRGYWIASDTEWNSVQETPLSPIPQSVRGSTMRSKLQSDQLHPMPSARNPSPYTTHLNNDSQGLISMLCGESHTIPRKPVGTRPISTQNNNSSAETIIHSNAVTESIQPPSDNNVVSEVDRPSKEANAEMYKQGRFPGNTRWAAQTLGLKLPRKRSAEQEDPFLGLNPYEKIETKVANNTIRVRSEQVQITTISRHASHHGEVNCHKEQHPADQYTTTISNMSTTIIGTFDGTHLQLRPAGTNIRGLRLKRAVLPGEGAEVRKELERFFPSGKLRLREEGVAKRGLRLKAIRPQ